MASALRTEEIWISNPQVLPVPQERKYYMFGTTDMVNVWEGKGEGFHVYVSSDLQLWQGPTVAFAPPPGFWADRLFWGGEAYLRDGKFILLGAMRSETARHRIYSMIADSPAGPYRFHSEQPLSPEEAIDPMLFVDDDDTPWLVYTGWETVEAVQLSKDLRKPAGEAIRLFNGSDAPWTTPLAGGRGRAYVTDAPHIHRLASGELYLLWSSRYKRRKDGKPRVATGVARSRSGRVSGPWEHDERLWFPGAHAPCTFRRFDGHLMLSIVFPVVTGLSRGSRPSIFELEERGVDLFVSTVPSDIVLGIEEADLAEGQVTGSYARHVF